MAIRIDETKLTPEDLELHRQAMQSPAVQFWDRLGKPINVFHAFSEAMLRECEEKEPDELFKGFGRQQAEWLLQETGWIIDEMQSWRDWVFRNYPDLKRGGLRDAAKGESR